MTVSSSVNKVSYAGNSSTTVFAYTFKIFDEDDLTVIIRAANGTETVKTITTHYTVSGVGQSGGGNVTMLTAPATGETLVIIREQDLVQELDIVPNDPFPADSVEAALDKLTFMVQQQQETLNRTIKASKTNTIAGSEFTISAADRANKVFAFDGSGDVSITQAIGVYRGNWATSTLYNVRDIVKDTSNDNIYICNTSHTSTGAQPISSNADVLKWDLLVDAASATASAAAASASASAASASASAAAGSASAAAADALSTAADAVSTAADALAASASATAAAASFDSFDDRYLGSKTADPTLDNDGNALLTGAIYWNSVTNLLKVYDGAAWVDGVLPPGNVDINGGTIDGTVIGGSTPAAATVTQLNSGPLAGFRNAIINGGFDIWQRGTSFTPGFGTFSADRWSTYFDGTGSTRTISRQAFTLGQTDVPGEPQYFLRYDQSVAGSGGTYNWLNQSIEGVRTFAGQPVTLSFYAKGSSAFNISAQMNQNFGTGGSPSSQTNTTILGTTALTTSWALYSATVTIPSISGKTLGTNGNDNLSFTFNLPLNTTFTFDLARLQIELGSVATPFERRPIGTEEALCKRYYRRWSGTSGTGYAVGQCFTATQYSVQLDLQPGMRATPTATSSNLQVWNAGGSGQSTTDLAVEASSSRNAVRMSGTVASGMVAGNVAYLNGSTTGFLALEAEL